MKTRMLAVALLASAALVAHVEAGNRHGNGGGNVVAARSGAVRSSGMPTFRSMPMRSFSGNRTFYSGQRFSSVGVRSPRMTEFRSRPINSSMGAPITQGQFTRGNMGINRTNQFGNNQRLLQNGNSFARNNSSIRNRTTGAGQLQNGNRLAPNWRQHVFAQRSTNWHPDWDRRSDHWWHGHRCHFFNGSWVIFDIGFYPWWPWWWDYPSYGYGYGYPYDSGYYSNRYGYDNGYGYNDSGAYDDQSGYDNGYNEQSGYQNSYGNQSANSAVAAAQDRLSQEGFYRGQIDGVLGPETRHAIVRFQTKHGLGISGELTTETLNAMGLRQYANY